MYRAIAVVCTAFSFARAVELTYPPDEERAASIAALESMGIIESDVWCFEGKKFPTFQQEGFGDGEGDIRISCRNGHIHSWQFSDWNMVKPIPAEVFINLAKMPNLEVLYLHNNLITEIPEEISLLTQVKHIWMVNNLMEEMPSLAAMENLVEISIQGAALTCIPEMPADASISFTKPEDSEARENLKQCSRSCGFEASKVSMKGNKKAAVRVEDACACADLCAGEDGFWVLSTKKNNCSCINFKRKKVTVRNFKSAGEGVKAKWVASHQDGTYKQ